MHRWRKRGVSGDRERERERERERGRVVNLVSGY